MGVFRKAQGTPRDTAAPPSASPSALPGRFGLGRSAERVCHSPEVTAARSEEQGDSPDRSWAGWARLRGLRHLRRSAPRALVSPCGCPGTAPCARPAAGLPPLLVRGRRAVARAGGAFAPRREADALPGSVSEGATAASGLSASLVQQGV